jgi:hypothetical protein
VTGERNGKSLLLRNFYKTEVQNERVKMKRCSPHMIRSQVTRIRGLSPATFFCGTGAETQGLHLEPLHQPFFVKGFFNIGSRKLFTWDDSEPDPPDLCLLNS